MQTAKVLRDAAVLSLIRWRRAAPTTNFGHRFDRLPLMAFVEGEKFNRASDSSVLQFNETTDAFAAEA